jgi:hypothetical protein
MADFVARQRQATADLVREYVDGRGPATAAAVASCERIAEALDDVLHYAARRILELRKMSPP